MRFGRLVAAAALLATSLPLLAAGHSRRTSVRLLRKHVRSQSRSVGQRTIDDSRAAEIQTALVGAGYLSGEPSGHWDAQTESAMQRYQADHGWQTRLMPDSRAIIKLGLGPKQAALGESAGSLAFGAPGSFSSTR